MSNKKEETTNIAHIIQLMIQICINIKILPELVLPHGLLTMGNSSHLPLKENDFNEALFESSSMDSENMTISCFASHLNKPCKFTYNSKSNIVGKTDGYILEYRKSLREGDNNITHLHDMTDINYDTLEWDPYKKNDLFDLDLKADQILYKENYNQLIQQNIQDTKNKKSLAMRKHILSRAFPSDFCSTKNLHVIDYVRSTPLDDKIIVFSNNIKALHELERDLLKKANIKCILVSGESTKHNSSHLEDFIHDNTVKVLLLSLKLGCMGLNLICANHILFLHQWWNPTIIDQAEQRCQRIGQTKPVYITHFILNKTIELFMANICFNKRRITSNIIGDDKRNNDDSTTNSDIESMDYSDEKNGSYPNSAGEENDEEIRRSKKRKLDVTNPTTIDDEYDRISDISAFSYNFAEYSIDRTLVTCSTLIQCL